MKFEWDEDKNSKNIEKHGISFQCATEIFLSLRITYDASREYQQERRKITVGYVDAYLILVVYTEREDRIRIISARCANENEKKLFNKYISKSSKRTNKKRTVRKASKNRR